MKKILLTTTLLFSCFYFFGQTLPEPPNFVIEKRILADDGAYWDYFGKSAAISEDGKTAVFGATRDDDNGLDSGSVYVFEQNATGQWLQTQKLIA